MEDFQMEGVVPQPNLFVTYRKIKVSIGAGNKTFTNQNYILDADIESVIGVALVNASLEAETKLNDLNVGLRIAGTEILPDDFEAVMVSTTLSIPPDNRYLTINQPKGGGKIELKVIDNNPNDTTYPYIVTLVIKCLAKSIKK